MNSYTATYLQKLLSRLGTDLTKTIAEQGLRDRNDTLPFFMKEVRWLDPDDSARKDAPLRRVLFAPTGCGKTTFSLAYARALAKLALKMPEDNDVEFIRKVAEKPCMEGMLEAGTPVIINARRSMAGDSPRSFRSIIDGAILAISDQRLEADGGITGKRLLIIDNLDHMRDAERRLRFIELLEAHLASTDDGLLLVSECALEGDARVLDNLPGAKAVTFGSLSDIANSRTGLEGLKGYFASALDSLSAELIVSEFASGKLSDCLKTIEDLLALVEIARAQRPLPMTRRDLYEEYADVIRDRALEGSTHVDKRCSAIEKLAMLCSQANCRADANRLIRECDSEDEVEAFCKLNDESEWEFKSQTLQSFLTSRAIERGIAGEGGQVGVDALLLVKDKQIKSEAIDFLSVTLHPDQQVLFLNKLDAGADAAETNLALAYLPKPESAEAANILYGNRFREGVYLSDAWVILSSDCRHRNAIEGFLSRHEEQRGCEYALLGMILQLHHDTDEDRVTFSWSSDEQTLDNVDSGLMLITTEWLRANGVSVNPSKETGKGGAMPHDLDGIGTRLRGMSMLPNVSSGVELIEMMRASA